jgi:hypothetical protein
MNAEREDYISLDPEKLRAMKYEEEVIQEMGTISKTEHEFRAELHKHVLDDAKMYRDFGWHVLLIGSMNIMPRSWEYMEPRHRPAGYKPQAGHDAERLDFHRKFFDQSRAEGFRGMDAWKIMNLKDSYVHYAIVNRELGERNAIIEAKVLDHVLDETASYYSEHDDHVSKNVVFDLACLSNSNHHQGAIIENYDTMEHANYHQGAVAEKYGSMEDHYGMDDSYFTEEGLGMEGYDSGLGSDPSY